MSSMILPLNTSSTWTCHLPVLSSHCAPTALWLVLVYWSRWYFFEKSLKYLKISPALAYTPVQSYLGSKDQV